MLFLFLFFVVKICGLFYFFVVKICGEKRIHVRFWAGYNESILRSKRHQLNESPKGVTGSWLEILTASWLICFGLFHFSQRNISIK